jgi:transcription elongation factor
MKLKTTPFAALGAIILSGPVSAATIVASSQSGPAYTVSSTDLLQTQLAATSNSLSINGVENGAIGGTVGILTNGSFGTANAAGGYVIAGGSITFTLNTSINTFGYDLSGIDTYAGWNDSGRDNQKYTVSYSTVSLPGTFITIASINDIPAVAALNKITITDIGATGVGAIRFTFDSPQENNGVGYKELDVFGTASVPEPSAALLGGLGMIALLRRRR